MKVPIMTVELTEAALCQTIEEGLKTAGKSLPLSEPVTMSSKMGSPREWDSLSFVSVFTAIGAHFDVELDDDDAVHFQTAADIYRFLEEILDE